MLKLILRDGDNEIELKELKGINADSEVVILFLKRQLEPEILVRMMDDLSLKLNKKVIILPNIFGDKVYGI